MNYGQLLTFLGSLFFIVYGILFSILPTEASSFVTDSVPSSTSAFIDMRATYGGMSIGAGIILALLARNASTINIGVIALFLLMVCMASTRTIGIFVDGDPNVVMYVYLALEIVVAVLCVACLVVDNGKGA